MFKKCQEIFALATQKGTTILLFIKDADIFQFPNYFYDFETPDKELEEILKNSNLDFYPEFFNYRNIHPVYTLENDYIYLYGCGLYNGERFERSFSEEKENPPTYLYYKDILVRDFRMVRGFIPYAYEIFGYINYKGKDLKLDVSRNEIIGGYKNLSNEFNKILLRYKKETETDVTVLKFLDKMLLYDEKELN